VLSIVPSIAGGVAVIDEDTASAIELDHDEILRYSRHLIMPEVALEGQKKLKAAKVLSSVRERRPARSRRRDRSLLELERRDLEVRPDVDLRLMSHAAELVIVY